jgi:hypothetical protein
MSKKKKKPQKVQPITLKKYIMEAARKLPIYKCWQLGDDESGIKHIVFARQKRDGTLIVGIYLVDLFCLGLKDTFFLDLNYEELEERVLENTHEGLDYEEVDPILAQNYIYGAIEYAEDLGFKPHKDFSLTEYILDDVEQLEFIEVELGHNGRPCFMPGPSDKVGQILAHLDKHVGEGNYDFIEEFDEEDNNDDEPDFYEELIDLEALEEEEFNEVLTSFLQISTEDAKQIYGRMWLYTFAIAEKFPDYVQVFGEYTENPASILEETIKHIKSKLQTLYDVDDEFIIYLTRLSLENYIEFDGTSYLGLKAFQQAVEEFVHPEMENKQFVTIFMITFEKKRDSHLKAICEIISNKLFDTYELKDLNIFQKNRVAKIFEEQYAKYLEDELVDDWEELEESFEAYDDIADYLPKLELEEIMKILSER